MSPQPVRGTAAFVLGIALLLAGAPGAAAQERDREGRRDPSRWDLRAGYSYQYKNTSRPNNFQLISVLPSTVIPLGGTFGPSWMRSKLEWNPELNLSLFTHPYYRPLIGANLLQFRLAVQDKGRWMPYAMLGAGILYANVNRRETRNDLNFNLHGAIGTYVHLTEGTDLILEYRHSHISNAGLHEDNAGINTHTFLAGISLKK